jgi:hypothetical protein
MMVTYTTYIINNIAHHMIVMWVVHYSGVMERTNTQTLTMSYLCKFIIVDLCMLICSRVSIYRVLLAFHIRL